MGWIYEYKCVSGKICSLPKEGQKNGGAQNTSDKAIAQDSHTQFVDRWIVYRATTRHTAHFGAFCVLIVVGFLLTSSSHIYAMMKEKHNNNNCLRGEGGRARCSVDVEQLRTEPFAAKVKRRLSCVGSDLELSRRSLAQAIHRAGWE